MSKTIKDPQEQGGYFLFNRYMGCERHGTVFITTGRSNGFQRSGAMTEDYVRALVEDLSKRLRELDAERGARRQRFVQLRLSPALDGVAFALGPPDLALEGEVDLACARYAQAFLNDLFGGGNVVRLRGKG